MQFEALIKIKDAIRICFEVEAGEGGLKSMEQAERQSNRCPALLELAKVPLLGSSKISARAITA
jgi:hypothetical protein